MGEGVKTAEVQSGCSSFPATVSGYRRLSSCSPPVRRRMAVLTLPVRASRALRIVGSAARERCDGVGWTCSIVDVHGSSASCGRPWTQSVPARVEGREMAGQAPRLRRLCIRDLVGPGLLRHRSPIAKLNLTSPSSFLITLFPSAAHPLLGDFLAMSPARAKERATQAPVLQIRRPSHPKPRSPPRCRKEAASQKAPIA